MLKILAQSIFSNGRPHNDTRISAFNVSSFNWLLRSLFTQLCLENSRSYVVVLAKLKLQSVPSQSCTIEIARVIENWKCLLECQDWSPTMFLVTNCSQCMLCHAVIGEVCRAHFCEVPPKQKNGILGWPKWHLTSVEDFNIKHCPHALWTLRRPRRASLGWAVVLAHSCLPTWMFTL